LKILMAFLLYNSLLANGVLVFFVDGARDLHSGIKEVFGWVPFKIILDWHHLEEKCKMQLSLALKGREIRNTVLAKVTEYLWVGKVGKAVDVLRHIEDKYIKSKDAIEGLIGYFDRNWSYIPFRHEYHTTFHTKNTRFCEICGRHFYVKGFLPSWHDAIDGVEDECCDIDEQEYENTVML